MWLFQTDRQLRLRCVNMICLLTPNIYFYQPFCSLGPTTSFNFNIYPFLPKYHCNNIFPPHNVTDSPDLVQRFPFGDVLGSIPHAPQRPLLTLACLSRLSTQLTNQLQHLTSSPVPCPTVPGRVKGAGIAVRAESE